MTARALLLVALLLLAGCSGLPLSEDPSASRGGTGTPTETTTDERPNGSAGATATPVGMAVAPRENPYGDDPLTVAIDNRGNASREFAPLVRQALDYWEENARQYAGYEVDYRLVPESTDPDVVVRVVDSVAECGRENHVAGCAPQIVDGPVDRPVTVRVRSGFSDASTARVLRHEFGHTLGLTHDDPPDVMRARTTLTTLPQRNATERAYPWNRSTLSVYVDTSALPSAERSEARRQVDAAIEYFDEGAGGTVPPALSFVRADSAEPADVVIRFRRDPTCQPGAGSCGTIAGVDPDDDGALERYTHLDVALVDVDTDAVAWHVARWLGRGMGLEAEEYPLPLRRSATYLERRGEWWRD
jgi:hypothetical protein